MRYINVLFPVYNEHLRLETGIRKTVLFMDKILEGDYWLTIIDNASDDDTPAIAGMLSSEFSQVQYIRLEEKGVGAAFRAGIAANISPLVGYMDIDLSTDLKHMEDVLSIFGADPKTGMVNASRWNKDSDTRGRKWYRNLTSNGLTLLLKATLGLKATDAICGFKFFRSEVAQRLIKEAGSGENGWFYIIELLLRAERGGIKIVELPVHWEDDYNSTVKVFPLIRDYCIQIIKLRKKFRLEKKAAGGNK